MSYKLIENDIYVELPKEKIKFASKEAETIYDLSLENDFLTRENEELKLQLKGTTHCFDEKEHKRLQEENKELRKQLKIKNDGFMASIEEKCELAEENKKYKEVVDKGIEYNKQVIKDIKDFYRPTEDVIYSGDSLIDIAEQNLDILKEANK